MTFNFMDMLTGFIVFLWASFPLLAPIPQRRARRDMLANLRP